MTMNDLLLGLHTDPFLTTVVVGLIWPMVQAALDRPYWTPARRKALLAVGAGGGLDVATVAGVFTHDLEGFEDG